MSHSLWWMLKLNMNRRGAPTCYQICAAHAVWKPWFFGWHLYQEATLSSQYISVILEVQHIMFSSNVSSLPAYALVDSQPDKKTSCWAVWIQEFSQPVQWQIQYLDLARSHSVEGFKTTSLCKGSSKIWSFVASESMSFAAPVQFSIIKLLFSASESFCFEAWLIRCFTGSRKDQKLKEQLTFTASGCHKFPWPGSQCVM